MADLTTSYMGLNLRNPIIVSSSDLTKDTESIIKCQEAGAGAVVLKSLFEEQFLEKESIIEKGFNVHPEVMSYFQKGGLLEYAPDKVCRMIQEAKREVEIPIIASINCQTHSLWPRFASQLQEAGADGLELNIYILPIEIDSPGEKYENQHVNILKEVKDIVSIPIAIKLVSQVTSISYLSQKLAQAGCDALVFFNWFLEPDINIHKLETRSIKGKGNIHQVLKWIALLAGRVDCDIAASGGIQRAGDVVKQLLAGASAVQGCTLFYQKGIKEIQNLLQGLGSWMNEHRYSTIEDFRGELSFKKQELSYKDLGEAESYFRAQYLKAYSDFE